MDPQTMGFQFIEIINTIKDSVKSQVSELVSMVTWSIWNSCNDFVMNNKQVSCKDVLRRAVSFFSNFRQANSNSHGNPLPQTD